MKIFHEFVLHILTKMAILTMKRLFRADYAHKNAADVFTSGIAFDRHVQNYMIRAYLKVALPAEPEFHPQANNHSIVG